MKDQAQVVVIWDNDFAANRRRNLLFETNAHRMRG
jgi:hypothetical protein